MKEKVDSCRARHERRMRHRLVRLSSLIVAGILLAACGLLLNPSQDASLATGSLSLSVAGLSAANARTIEPPVAMVSASYDISGSGPDAASFSVTGITGSSYQRDGLALGSWDIAVTAHNAGGTAIGEGSATVEIASGAPASATVTVRPYSGTGSIKITVSWPEDAVANGDVAGTVDRPNGTMGETATFSANADGHSWTWTDNAAAAGYHTLYFEILSGSESVGGDADSIRVLKDTITEYEFTFTAAQLALRTAKPVLSLAAGSYPSAQSLTISCATSGVTIKYTNNGSIPSATNGFTYASPVAIASDQTIRAIAVMTGRAFSAIASAAYTIAGSIAVPTLSPAPGLYYDPIDVSLSCATADALIMYTTDGVTVPAATSGTVYIAPFAVAADTTVRAIAKNTDGSLVSDLTEAVYRVTGHVAALTASGSAGTYYAEQTVSLSCATETSEIRYTLDGSDPSLANGSTYFAPLVINRSRALNARAFRTDWDPSPLASYQYELKVPSPSLNLDTGTYYAEQTVSLACALSGATINWTNDGVTTPSATEGSVYADPLTIERTRTVLAIAFRNGWTNSDLVTRTFTLKCVTPSITPAPGAYLDDTIPVRLATTTIGATLAYTVDESTPTLTNGVFGNLVNVNTATTLKAVALKTGWSDSEPATGLYTPNTVAIIPTDSAALTDTTPLLSWTNSAVAVKYELKLADSTAALDTVAVIETNEASYQIPAAFPNGATRYWRVRPVNADGVPGVWRGDWSFTVTVPQPTLTSPAASASLSDTTPDFDWSDVVDAQTYHFQLSTVDTFASTVTDIDSLTGSSYSQSAALANDTTYYWRVSVKDIDGVWSAWTDTRSFAVSWNPAITPTTPTDAATTTDTTPLLDWNDSDGAASYEIKIADSVANLTAAATLTSAVSSYQITSALPNGATRYWRVRPVNADGVPGAWRGDWSFTANAAVPTLSSPSADATLSDTTPDFSWGALAGTQAYRFQLSTQDGFATTVTDIATLIGTSYSQSSALTNDTTYYWRLAARNADGVWSAWTSARSFTVNWNPIIMLTAPADAAATTDTTPLLDWSDASGATSYEVKIADSFDNLATAAIVTSVTSNYQITSALPNGATRFWRVRPVNDDGVPGAWRGDWSFTVTVPLPTLASPAASASLSDTTPDFDWSDVADAQAYRLQLSTVDTFASMVTDIENLTGSSYTQSVALANDMTYYWRVSVKDVDGVWSAWTSGRSFAVSWNPAITPTSPTNAATTTDTTPLLDWSDADVAASYEIKIADSFDNLATAATLTAATSSYQIPAALPNGATRYWRVRPVNADGVPGAWRGDWSFVVNIPAGIAIDDVFDNPPTISFSVIPQVFYEGQTLNISATVTPTPASYLWLLDGKAISGATAAALSLDADGIIVGYYQLALRVKNGTIAASKEINFRKVDGPVPLAPTLSAPADGGVTMSARPSFSWSAAANAVSYELALASSLAGLDGATPATTAATSWTPSSDLVYGTWYWRVRSKDSYGGYSAWSATRSFGRSSISMVSVPAGSFNNGTSTVNLSAFQMSSYEITQSQYQTVMGSNPASGYGVGANYPVYYVSWYDALVFCNKLSIQEGLTPVYTISGSTNPAGWGTVPTSSNSTWNAAVMDMGANGYRLPTEAEWEYAARGGTPVDSYTYAGSDTIDGVAWYSGNSGSTSHAVGGKTPNKLGLYDMSGNVWEWCWDWYGSYPSGTQTNPSGAASGTYRVDRSGSWYNFTSNSTVSNRSYQYPYNKFNYYGFRVVRRP